MIGPSFTTTQVNPYINVHALRGTADPNRPILDGCCDFYGCRETVLGFATHGLRQDLQGDDELKKPQCASSC